VTALLELSTRRGDDGFTVLTAAGEVDMSNAARFAAALADAAATAAAGQAGADFTVDLTAVSYLDSAGLTALLPYASRITIVATGVLAPVLAVSGLEPVTTVVPAP
jgi:anti-sigma B factor antagonist